MTEPLIIVAPADAPARQQPPVSPAAEPFWDATRVCRLDLQWCRPCARAIHFPREVCPSCLGTDLEFRPAAGTGTVYSLSEMPVPGNPGMAGRSPYLVALIELPEGVRILSNVFAADGAAATGVSTGDAVRVAWEALADGRHLPIFVPA